MHLRPELPSPPPYKTGWPWEPDTTAADVTPAGPLPPFAVVTPSYNQADFLEETIRSVLLQEYPGLQYYIVDGGSTDGSVEIIQKYAPFLHGWVSEPDRGQVDAITRGFLRTAAPLLAYLNSDDLYEPMALRRAGDYFAGHPDTSLLAGRCTVFNREGPRATIDPWWPDNIAHFVKTTSSSTISQAASFWTRDLYDRLGGFNPNLHFCFDHEFFLRAGLQGVRPHFIRYPIARFREHNASKTLSRRMEFHREFLGIVTTHGRASGLSWWQQWIAIRQTRAEIDYIRIFTVFRQSGRVAALCRFVVMCIAYPPLLLQRRIMGQLRRLLFFTRSAVKEYE